MEGPGWPAAPHSVRRGPTASRVRRLKHHDQVCSSATKVPWYARTRESLRLLPRAGGGAMALQRTAVTIERSLVPIISTVAARSGLRMRRTIALLALPCMSPARPLGFGWAGAKDGCPAAACGAVFAVPHRPSAPGSLNGRIRYFGDFAKLARCAYNCLQNPLDLLTERIVG